MIWLLVLAVFVLAGNFIPATTPGTREEPEKPPATQPGVYNFENLMLLAEAKRRIIEDKQKYYTKYIDRYHEPPEELQLLIFVYEILLKEYNENTNNDPPLPGGGSGGHTWGQGGASRTEPL